MHLEQIADGLQFPEGPVAMADGSVLVVEMAAGRITRVTPDGGKETVAEPGGGPNGQAIGPDGALYVCNNGNSYDCQEMGGILFPHQPSPRYEGHGRIERVDLDSGEVEVLYTRCDGYPLRSPNDIVFDRDGNMWITDHGYIEERSRDRTGIYWARPDGSDIREVAFPLDAPNGIGISPEGDRLYVAETYTGRVWWWPIDGEGQLTETPGMLGHGGQLLAGLPDLQALDSLGVDSEGHVCVATLVAGGVTRISPDGAHRVFYETGDPLTTNIAWGGEGRTTAFMTLSGTGRLVSCEWPVPGLELAFNA